MNRDIFTKIEAGLHQVCPRPLRMSHIHIRCLPFNFRYKGTPNFTYYTPYKNTLSLWRHLCIHSYNITRIGNVWSTAGSVQSTMRLKTVRKSPLVLALKAGWVRLWQVCVVWVKRVFVWEWLCLWIWGKCLCACSRILQYLQCVNTYSLHEPSSS